MTLRRNAQHLRFSLFGIPRWRTELGDGHLDGWRAQLVALLTLEPAPDAIAIAQRLWPTQPSASAFNTYLSRLRRDVEHDVCNTKEGSDRLRLKPQVAVDVTGSPDGWPRGDDPREVCFLYGVEPIGTLAAWLEEQRAFWAKALRLNDALRLVADLEANNELASSLEAARAAIGLAPDLADGWLAKARALYLNADRDGARLAFARAETLLPMHAPTTRAQLVDLKALVDLRRTAVPPRGRLVPASLVRPPHLVGRESVGRAMEDAWAAGRPFVLTGEMGIGKSRLLQDFLRNRVHVRVDARVGEERAPYAVLGALLREVINKAALGEGAPESRHPHDPLAALAGVLSAGADVETEAPVDALAVRTATKALLEREAAAPVFAVEDMSHADLASLDLLRSLSQEMPSIRLAFTTCPLMPGPRRERLDAWAAAPGGIVAIEVSPWNEAELTELLSTVALPRAASHATPSRLSQATRGVPQLVLWELQRLAFVDEVDNAENAVSVGTALARGDGGSTDSNALLHAGLQRLLELVPASARPLLELAAVADATTVQLAQGLECSAAELEAMMAELNACGLMFDGSHVDKMLRETIRDSLPPAVARRWNAVAAAVLISDRRVPRARIGAHWEAAGRWQEAAAAYRSGGLSAIDLGAIDEARDLLRHAVACSARAGDRDGEFDALHDSVVHEIDLHGPDAARPLVSRMLELADSVERRAAALAHLALVEISHYHRNDQALAPARAAFDAAEMSGSTKLSARASSLLALASAQAGHHAEADSLSQRAYALARMACTPRHAREIGTHRLYVLYEGSRIGSSIDVARELLPDYERVADLAGAAFVQSNLAALLLLAGDPLAALEPGLSAHKRHCGVEARAETSAAVMNRISIAQSLGFAGRFAEAMAFLVKGEHRVGAEAIAIVRAKAQLVRAHLLLLLGDDAAAVSTLGDGKGWTKAMLARRFALLAQAAAMRGEDASQFLRLADDLFEEDVGVPLPHRAWFDWSAHGDARAVNARLQEVQPRFVEAGMPGVARSIALRRIDRLLMLDAVWAGEEAGRLATELRFELPKGLCASTYLPQAWQTLARAFRRNGDADVAATCEEEARHWILNVALPNVPAKRRHAFLTRNPVNRALLDGEEKAGIAA